MLMQVLDHANEKADEHVPFGELIDLKSPTTIHDMMQCNSADISCQKVSLFTFCEIKC